MFVFSMVLVASCWSVVILSYFAIATRLTSWSRFATVAVLHDALPLLLAGALIALVIAIIRNNVWLILSAAPLAPVYFALWFSARRTAERPSWVKAAPTFTMLVTNVYVDNATPDAMAQMIVTTAADVAVVAEWNETIAAALRRAGGDRVYPHQVFDEHDTSDYAVAILTQQPPSDQGIDNSSSIAVVRVTIPVGTTEVTVLGVNPYATIDKGGYQQWRTQTADLEAYLTQCKNPFVIAGDFNSSQFRPEFQCLLNLGLTDVHDALGQGLNKSLKLSADGAFSAIGAVARLDHALVSEDVFPLDAENLESSGSDHLPFLADLAVRSAAPQSRLSRRPSRS